jgi:hypothetical protein
LSNRFAEWFGEPRWDREKFEVDVHLDELRKMRVGTETLAEIYNVSQPDLTRFAERGGKLIMYHGWYDRNMPVANSVRQYRRIVTHLGKRGDDVARLFLVPGMEHCSGGAGADAFGADGVLTGVSTDPRHHALTALQAWVEQGTKPVELVASKYLDGVGVGAPVRTALLCPYPLVARYSGVGDRDSAASYACANQ